MGANINRSVANKLREVILPLCSCKKPPGVVRPALVCSVQERHRSVRAGPEQVHEKDQRAGAPPLWRKAERVGAVQPGEEEVRGRPCFHLSIFKRDL